MWVDTTNLSKEDFMSGQTLLINKEKNWTSFDVVKNTYFAINTLVLAISPVIHIGPATHNYMKEANLSGDNHGPRTGDLH